MQITCYDLKMNNGSKKNLSLDYFFSKLSIVMTISLLFSALLSSYFLFPFTSMFSLGPDDGWCEKEIEGVGVHCFGDFYHPLIFANTDEPWNQPLAPPPYPPIIMRFMSIFVAFGPDNSRLPLIIYMAMSVISFAFPIFFLYLKKELSRELTLIVLGVVFMATPIICTLDRGNSIAFCFPFAFFFFRACLLKQSNLSLIHLVILVQIKPQLIVFSLFFLITREFGLLLRSILLSAFVLFFSFFLYPADFFGNMRGFLNQFFGFQEFLTAGWLFRGNLSIPNLISSIEKYLIPVLQNSNERVVEYPSQFYFTIILIIALSILYRHYLPGINEWKILLFISLVPILFPNVGGVYYLIFPLAVLISKISIKCPGNSQENYLPSSRWFLYPIVISLSPIGVPWALLFISLENVLPGTKLILSQPEVITFSAHWVLVTISLVILAIYLLFTLKSGTENCKEKCLL